MLVTCTRAWCRAPREQTEEEKIFKKSYLGPKVQGRFKPLPPIQGAIVYNPPPHHMGVPLTVYLFLPRPYTVLGVCSGISYFIVQFCCLGA